MVLDVIKDYLSMAGSIAVILGVVFLVVQISRQTKIAKADHDRKKKQSTIEFCNIIFSESEVFLYKIDKENFKFNLASVESDKDIKEGVEKYLYRIERLAVGITSEIYDFDILNLIVGQHIIKAYYLLEIYIKEVRKMENDQMCYYEFERLARKLDEHRKEHPNKTAGVSSIVKSP